MIDRLLLISMIAYSAKESSDFISSTKMGQNLAKLYLKTGTGESVAQSPYGPSMEDCVHLSIDFMY